MNAVEKVNKLCKSVLKLTDEDFTEVEQLIKEQTSYVHPLKHATQAKYQDLGDHNAKVLAALKNLHQVIKSGEPVVKRKVQKI